MAIEAKVGDVVHVRGVFVKQSEDAAFCVVDFTHGGRGVGAPQIWVKSTDIIVEIESPAPPIKVGDMVEYRGLGWTVIGVDGDRLWIKIVGLHVIEYASVHRDEVQKHS